MNRALRTTRRERDEALARENALREKEFDVGKYLNRCMKMKQLFDKNRYSESEVVKRMQRENAEAKRHIAFLTASRDELEQRARALSQQLDMYIFHSNSPATNGDAGRPPTPGDADTEQLHQRIKR